VNRCAWRHASAIGRLAGGFTLIEILVVVVILAVVAVAVTLSTGAIGGSRRLAHEAARMRALVSYACEQAELTGREIGVSLNTDGYRFSRLDRSDWQPIASDELRPRHWLKGTSVALTRDGHPVTVASDFPDKPQLVCFSSGELTAFRIVVGLTGVAARYRIDGRPDGTAVLTVEGSHVR